MDTSIIIEEDLILLNLNAQSSEDVLNKMSKNLLEKGHVYESFNEALINREKAHATGLPTVEFAVAIPHTDIEHVVRDALSIAVLNKPIVFHMMGTESTELEVEMVFVLAVKNPDRQTKMLQSLMGLFQNAEVLKQLRSSNNQTEFIKLLKENMTILNENL